MKLKSMVGWMTACVLLLTLNVEAQDKKKAREATPQEIESIEKALSGLKAAKPAAD